MKKEYISPLAVGVNIEATNMLAASIEIGNGTVDPGTSLSNKKRNTWGNLWE